MKSNSAKFRDLCIQTYLDCNLTPAEVAANLIEELHSDPIKHLNLSLPRATAESIIQTTFVRKYDKDKKYIGTIAPVERKNTDVVESLLDVIEDNPNKTPDFEHAATLTKGDLDVYAEIYGINLNRSMTKANMLIDFQEQWANKA